MIPFEEDQSSSVSPPDKLIPATLRQDVAVKSKEYNSSTSIATTILKQGDQNDEHKARDSIPGMLASEQHSTTPVPAESTTPVPAESTGPFYTQDRERKNINTMESGAAGTSPQVKGNKRLSTGGLVDAPKNRKQKGNNLHSTSSTDTRSSSTDTRSSSRRTRNKPERFR
jgi:hypothetical protein